MQSSDRLSTITQDIRLLSPRITSYDAITSIIADKEFACCFAICKVIFFLLYIRWKVKRKCVCNISMLSHILGGIVKDVC